MSERRPSMLSGLPVGRWFLIIGLTVSLAFIGALAYTAQVLGETRGAHTTLGDAIDPGIQHTLEFTIALAAQEGSVRSYGLTKNAQFQGAYRDAVAQELAAIARMTALLPLIPERQAIGARLGELAAASESWRRAYAGPVMGDGVLNMERAQVNSRLFAEIRTLVTAQELQLDQLHRSGADHLEAQWDELYLTLGLLVALLVLAGVTLTFIVRYAVLQPITQLAEQTRAVASGDFDHRLEVDRPAELRELSGHVDAMRRRMMTEWRRAKEAQELLEVQTNELRRSNGELEQFAYVASHDLQEPLRKVASFTQMLEQRYADQLDDRARQYIHFAVDGAKRMQFLINDLLDFSRVGRVRNELVRTDSGAALTSALENLAVTIEESGANVTHDEMPPVLGNRMLLAQLFQNMVGNALKFRSEETPKVHIGVRLDGEMWEFSCTDNGIGIEQKYTDRIFLIFQRLHPKDEYPGTGIGLALCRKIVEFHGGTIWLDHELTSSSGTTFRWTLPVAPGETDDE